MDGFSAEGSNLDAMQHYSLLSIESAPGSDPSGIVTLPSGEDFLRADFTRSGPDLIIETPGGQAYVVPDFYMQATPPALVTAEGAQLSGSLVTALAGPAAPGQVAQLSIEGIDTGTSAQGGANLGAPIGQVNELDGAVTATRADGTQVMLATGDPIYQGDVIETGGGANVGVVFLDDTIFTLDEDGRMVMDEMVYDPGTQTGTFNAQVVQGVFSFVSGQVAKTSPDAMTVATPTSTIGIRGSTVVIKVVGASGESQVMLVQDVDGNVGEISVFNDAGAQVLSQPGASTVVSSFTAAPAPQIVMSQQEFQQTFGKAFTTLTKVVAAKAQQDAQQASQQAEQKDSEAREAADAAQKASADAEAAKAEAEAKAAAAAQAAAEAEAAGNEEALAAAQQQAAEAEAAAQAAAEAEAAAQAAQQAAQAKAAEAQAAQEQAQQALQFQAQAQTVFTQQDQAFQTFQQQNPDAANDPTAGTADTAQNATTANGENNDQNNDDGGDDGGNTDGGNTETGDVVITITVDPVTGELTGEIVITVSDETFDELTQSTTTTTTGTQQTTDDTTNQTNNNDDATPTNAAPTADPVNVSGNEDTTLTGQITANDPEGGTLTYTLASGPANGSVVLNADGSFDYTPVGDFAGTDSFDVLVEDAQGATATATVTLTLANVNDAPVVTVSTTGVVKQHSFTLSQDWSTYDMKDVAALDFDGDADQDIVFSYYDGSQYQMALATNNGTGTFAISDMGIASASYHFEVGDLNADGRYDIVQARAGSAVSPVYFQNADGTFSQTTQSFDMYNAYEIKLADMNGDGLLDIVAANTVNGSTPNRILYNNDGGVAGQFADSGQLLANNDTKSVAVGDLNNDGTIDAVFGNWNNIFEVHLNEGDGTMSNTQNIDTGGATLGVELGDLDGDGDLDAFLASRYSGNLVMLNDGTGTFTDSGQVLGATTHEHHDVKLGDLDGDGDLDAVVANYNSADQIWINDGQGNFTEAGLNLATGIGNAVALGDFDGDGRTDFVLGQVAGAGTGVYQNGTVLYNETLLQGGSFTFSSTHLSAIDVDNAPAELTYTLTVSGLPANGALKLNGTALDVNGTFTQADVDAGHVVYQHDGSVTASDTFTYTLSDGLVTSSVKSFNLSVKVTTGDAANNTLENTTDSEAFDGGAGTDTLTMGGALADHSFSASADGTLTVTDTTTGGDTDTVTNIETLTFSDANVGVSTQAGERLVNTTTTGDQIYPKVVGLNDGGSIVAWYDPTQQHVFMQRYDAAGDAIGSETQLSSSVLDNSWFMIEAFDNGGYGVTWINATNTLANLYDANGTQVGTTITLNTAAAGRPDLTGTNDGGFLATFESADASGLGIYGRFYDSAGTALTTPFQINTTTNTDQFGAQGTTLSDGSVLVVWYSRHLDGTNLGIYARVVDYDGTSQQFVTNDLLIDDAASYEEAGASVTAMQDGGFAISWMTSTAFTTGVSYDVFMQRYDASGNTVGSKISVATFDSITNYSNTSIAELEDGGFVVTWAHEATSGDLDVHGQLYDANGTAVGSSFLINTTTAAGQYDPIVSATPDGGFVVTWSSPDAGGDGVYTQRFDASGNKLGYATLTGDANNNAFFLEPSQSLVHVDGGTGTDSVDLGGVSGDQNLIKATNIETITGGDADDMVLLGAALAGTETIDLGAGHDTVKLADGANANTTFTNTEEVIGGTGNDTITINTTFGAADEAFYEGLGGTDSLTLTAGNDVFDAYGFESIDAGAGSDEWRSKHGVDLSGVTSLTGVETISIDSDNNEQTSLNMGLNGAFSSAITVVGSGDDVIEGGDSMDLTNATVMSGISTIRIDNDGTNTVAAQLTLGATTLPNTAITIAGTGDDEVVMGYTGTLDLSNATLSGISTIRGSAGADTINGTSGADTIATGAGADVVQYTTTTDSKIGSMDHISDFTAGAGGDQIDTNISTAVNVIANQSAGATTLAGLTYSVLNTLADPNVGSLGTKLSGAGTTEVMELTTSDTKTVLAIDVNGDGVFDANNDTVLEVTGMTGTLDASNFI